MNSKAMILSLCFFLKSTLSLAQDWRTADRSSIGIAPKASEEKRAIVQIYSARTYGWKGNLAVHPWIAIKPANASDYEIYEVIGYYAGTGRSVVRMSHRDPDSRWFGNEPQLHFEARGTEAEEMIPHMLKAIESYPYPDDYRVYPGPNSNTFVSYVMRNTPGIYADLPPNAIGKDWIGQAQPFGVTESGTGLQFSLFGMLGARVGLVDGVEVNILGMNFGIDFVRPAIKLPFVGRLGFKDKGLFQNSEEN